MKSIRQTIVERMDELGVTPERLAWLCGGYPNLDHCVKFYTRGAQFTDKRADRVFWVLGLGLSEGVPHLDEPLPPVPERVRKI